MRSSQTLSIKKPRSQRVNGLKTNSVLKMDYKKVQMLQRFVGDISSEYLYLVEHPKGSVLSLNDELLAFNL